MLINFTLVPVQEVAPWGTPGDLSLSWFGLTDGQYWLEAGSSVLFEYSKYARSHGSKQYCDYQVVRLYEDLTDMLPSILEPVPTSLVQYISGETAISWQRTFEQWREEYGDRTSEDRFWEVVSAATEWQSKRHLDSLYLSPSANIAIWSDVESVHLEWDNREKQIDGQPAWTALKGAYKLPRSDFAREVESFHTRLMDQMEERVHRVSAGALSAEIDVDLAALAREHEQRRQSLRVASDVRPETDWLKVERTIHEIHSDLRRGQA
ncbi:DUF5984 family protein [Caenimonas sedimenti]|uniref:DUF5984 family protein n=1 Tax=Caenimonas sedimenti TaxID=2596921 RepID=UPI001C96988F|nr:DUF5984 family protein [Caenimonas sedimenti]